MTITPTSGRFFVRADQYLKLDSNVQSGGGTDQTDILQAILDMAPVWGGLHLYLNGAVLTKKLRIHGNTRIECPNLNCGLYLCDGQDSPLLVNAHYSTGEIEDKGISLLGGTYNFNCAHQNRYPGFSPQTGFRLDREFFTTEWSHGMIFYGVKDLLIRDCCLVNQRTFTVVVANFHNVVVENVNIPLPECYFGENQDGFHFFGPGTGLTIRNIYGRSGDDFLAIAPDELTPGASITDVTVDGVYLRDADQVIRMISRGTGRLDRVFVRNVYGTYKSFGIAINPWFSDGVGNYGSICIENVHLQPTAHKYPYCEPYMFRAGGCIANLRIRGVTCLDPADSRTLLCISHDYGEERSRGRPAHIKNLVIEDVTVQDSAKDKDSFVCIYSDAEIDQLTVKNVTLQRSSEAESVMLQLRSGSRTDVLRISDVTLQGKGCLVSVEEDAQIGCQVRRDNVINGEKESTAN